MPGIPITGGHRIIGHTPHFTQKGTEPCGLYPATGGPSDWTTARSLSNDFAFHTEYTISVPSGEKHGEAFWPPSFVMRTTPEPSTFIS
jgi:hypothetical protein